MPPKTLEEHNANRGAIHARMMNPEKQMTGIACPLCGEELHNPQPNISLTSMPPQIMTKCGNCNYIGTAVD